MSAASVPVDDGLCVGCGPDSAIGLHMYFARDEDGSVVSRFVVPQRFQGWRDVVHGGIVALVLDEAMAYAAAATGWLGVTADLKLRFRSEVPVASELVVRGRVLWQRRDVLAITATLVSADGRLLASAEGRFLARGEVQPGTRLGCMRDGRAGG